MLMFCIGTDAGRRIIDKFFLIYFCIHEIFSAILQLLLPGFETFVSILTADHVLQVKNLKQPL